MMQSPNGINSAVAFPLEHTNNENPTTALSPEHLLMMMHLTQVADEKISEERKIKRADKETFHEKLGILFKQLFEENLQLRSQITTVQEQTKQMQAIHQVQASAFTQMIKEMKEGYEARLKSTDELIKAQKAQLDATNTELLIARQEADKTKQKLEALEGKFNSHSHVYLELADHVNLRHVNSVEAYYQTFPHKAKSTSFPK